MRYFTGSLFFSEINKDIKDAMKTPAYMPKHLEHTRRGRPIMKIVFSGIWWQTCE
ncbi:MAG TPA: hypothetical protein VHO03_00135 [Ignavibacteriales bacterium]|nr:hypothetical protein [Ignavibacteriales bacterium]